jgi:hypothetical protein
VGRNKLRLTLATAVVAGALAAAIPIVGSATGLVAKLVFSPSPIGTTGTVPAGSNVSVQVTALDSTGKAISGATVFLAFQQSPGGGTAFSGTTGLTQKQQMFTADSSGHVAITYSTPPSYPTTGCDVLKAENGPTRATSTAVASDAFCFSPITAINFLPKPIARHSSLGANAHVAVTLTVFGANGARLANGTVWVSFKKATGGGSATINGVALTGTAVQATTNSNGQVFIAYSTPSVLPVSGSKDKLVAANSSKLGTIVTTDEYKY